MYKVIEDKIKANVLNNFNGVTLEKTIKPSLQVSATATQELPTQIVIDFFSQGIPITQAPKDIVLKKSNAAIQVNSTLGLLERKIIDACFFIARPKMCENTLHSADIEYFKWLLSFNSQNREYLKKSITKIQQTLIQINIIDETNPNKDFWHSTNFLYDVSITNGKIYFRIPESIRQPMMDPKSWTYLSFRIKNRFTSEYAYILYERCREAKFKGATAWWSIPEFRAIMNAADIYQQFQDLQKRVIKPAIEQINELSDILITPDYQTKGRTKTHIRFIIDENPNVTKFEQEIEKLPMELFEALKGDFGFSNSQIDEVAEYPIEYLAEKIEFTRHRIKTSKTKINRPDLYLLKALKEDLRFNASEIAIFESEQKAQERKDLEKKQVQKTEMYSKKIKENLIEFYVLNENEQKILLDEFRTTTHFKNISMLVGINKPINLESKIVKSAFNDFLTDISTSRISWV